MLQWPDIQRSLPMLQWPDIQRGLSMLQRPDVHQGPANALGGKHATNVAIQ
jgi:hypothetical protein